MMMKSVSLLLLAMARSASAADSFNVKIKYLCEAPGNIGGGDFSPATDDKLGQRCDYLADHACGIQITAAQCERFDRSIDVFSQSLLVELLFDVSIETSAPYAIHTYTSDDTGIRSAVSLVVGEEDLNLTYIGSFRTGFCTGYNGYQSTWCTQLPNVAQDIESKFWNGGTNPGAGNTGWGTCVKCPKCY